MECLKLDNRPVLSKCKRREKKHSASNTPWNKKIYGARIFGWKEGNEKKNWKINTTANEKRKKKNRKSS